MKKRYADMEPLEEIRAIREEISCEFKSLKDLGEHLRNNHPLRPSPESSCNGRQVVAKAEKRSASRRRKTLVHA